MKWVNYLYVRLAANHGGQPIGSLVFALLRPLFPFVSFCGFIIYCVLYPIFIFSIHTHTLVGIFLWYFLYFDSYPYWHTKNADYPMFLREIKRNFSHISEYVQIPYSYNLINFIYPFTILSIVLMLAINFKYLDNIN